MREPLFNMVSVLVDWLVAKVAKVGSPSFWAGDTSSP